MNNDLLLREVDRLADFLFEHAVSMLKVQNPTFAEKLKRKSARPPRIIIAVASLLKSQRGWHSCERWTRNGKAINEIAILPEAVSDGVAKAGNSVLHDLFTSSITPMVS